MLKTKLLLCQHVRQVAFDVSKQWEGVVGLEVHAQILSNSKLFSGAGTCFLEPINKQVSLFDAAIPGTLPVLNKECVRKGVFTAVALNCKVHETSSFDRKHYFYADLPAGYQITQQRAPFATDGLVEFPCYSSSNRNKAYLKTCRIKQIQLEQDSGKSVHDPVGNLSYVDLNRAGNPLMEIVFEPDLQTADEAACLVKELMLIFKALNTCSCKIEEGALRVDANISVRPKGSNVLETRTEVKNIGGVANVLKAVDFEIQRQIRRRKVGGSVVNETRAWDSSLNRTVAMRDKEVEQDYRFIPETNLPPLRLSLDEKDTESGLINAALLKKQLPELPAFHRNNLIEKYNLPVDTVLRLLSEPVLLDYFFSIMNENGNRNPVKISNFLMIDLVAAVGRASKELEKCEVEAKKLAELHDLLSFGTINRVIFHRILDTLVAGCKESPSETVERDQLFQINDPSIIEESCKLAIEFNPEWVQEYRKSKKLLRTKNLQRLFNEAVTNTQGRANLIMTKEVLTKMLDKTNNEPA